MAGQMESVRRNYDVPAYRGRRVLWLGERDGAAHECTITSSTGSHLRLRTVTGRILLCHPCWKIDYLDGRGDRTGQPTPMDRAWKQQREWMEQAEDAGSRDV